MVVNIVIKMIPLSLIERLPIPKFEDPAEMKDNFIAKTNAKIKNKFGSATEELMSVGA